MVNKYIYICVCVYFNFKQIPKSKISHNFSCLSLGRCFHLFVLTQKTKTKHDTALTLSRWRGAGGRGAKSVPGSTRGRRARAAGGGAEASGQPGLESLSDLLAVCGRSPGLLHPHVAAPHARSGIRRALRQWSCDEPGASPVLPLSRCEGCMILITDNHLLLMASN